MQTLLAWRDLLECLSFLAIILGVPAAIYQYYRTARKEQVDREYGTYNALDEKYLDFLMLCFQHPRLDIFDVRDTHPRDLSEDERKLELIAYTILISLFERAYLMYSDQSTEIKTRQWTGWHAYIHEYCTRPNFRAAWRISGETFDSKFESFMKVELRRTETKPEGSALSSTDENVGSQKLEKRDEAKHGIEASKSRRILQRIAKSQSERGDDVKPSGDDDLET